MELHRLGVKFFAADPASIRLEDLIPVFHSWIQRQAIPGHILIDVHDYSHIQNGPGILLVAHEGNFSLDMAGGRPGLFYYRKTPTGLPPAEHIAAIVNSAVQACTLLEQDAKVQVRMDEMLFVANDRLEAPSEEATFAEFKPLVAEGLAHAFPGTSFNMTRPNANPKERLTIAVQRQT